ncbi:MAG: SCP2 sterol-binding domain-containing protein [Candidatus Aminicenantes bacterium]|nr:MAG: SCP2 sterol-binding domain-containing protein [Candidatus Aminicenantes bacterium]
MDIINGKLNPAEAYMQEKIHVTGDATQVQLLGKLLISV